VSQPRCLTLHLLPSNTTTLTNTRTHKKLEAATRCLPLTEPRSPSITYHPVTGTTFNEFPLRDSSRTRLQDTALAINPQSSTTASQQQTWLPSPASARHPPQPTFTDFDLFQTAPTTTPGHQATPRRAPSLDSTLQPSFNAPLPAGSPAYRNLNSAQTNLSTQRSQRSTRPPVPLFHSNSAGNLVNRTNFNIQTPDIANFDMGGGGKQLPDSPLSHSSLMLAAEINVAYEGTFGDLSAADASLFTMDNTEFQQLMAAGTDGFTAINGNGGTVSPQDVFNNDSFPPSTSFTNLTTPGSTLLDTPDEDYQTSPLFNDNLGAYSQGGDDWFPLFPTDDNSSSTPAPLMARTTSTSSATQIVVHPGGEGNRKRSSTTALSPSPVTFSPATKHSNVAGVNARKRDKPLPPIVVDESDQVALKRARNTAAARKSRAKKCLERDDMEAEIADLKQQVEHWKNLALARIGGDVDADA